MHADAPPMRRRSGTGRSASVQRAAARLPSTWRLASVPILARRAHRLRPRRRPDRPVARRRAAVDGVARPHDPRAMIDDLRQAWRGLRAMPLVATVVVASLGLGVGANTTVFSWLQMVRWKPLPGVAGAATLQVLEMRTEG